MRSRLPLAGILALALAVAPAAWARKLYPVDEGPRDRSFVVFRRKLIAAARKHDRRFILSILDPHIQNSFGEDSEGIRDFKGEWDLDKPHSDLWPTLTSVLSLGGAFRKREFCAPYVFTEFPDDLDDAEYRATIGRHVKVRARPSFTAPVIAFLSYDIVRVTDPGPAMIGKTKLFQFSDFISGSRQWIGVVTPKGKRGYVEDRFVRSPIDYRACFRKVKGKWRMTALVSGD